MNTQRNAVCLGLTAGLLLGAASQGAIYSSGTLNEVIPDYNSSTSTPGEWADSITVGDLTGLQISGVTLTLDVSDGWNGDLYAYLSYTPATGSGALINLMDRSGYSGSGYGYGDPGFAITLSDDGVSNYNPIETYQGFSPSYNLNGQLTGTWNADGAFSVFNDKDANGTWTLYFSDMESGSASTVVSWSLDITAVPEPTHIAVGVFGGIFAVVGLLRRRFKKA